MLDNITKSKCPPGMTEWLEKQEGIVTQCHAYWECWECVKHYNAQPLEQRVALRRHEQEQIKHGTAKPNNASAA
jgi:hypothetical protein